MYIFIHVLDLHRFLRLLNSSLTVFIDDIGSTRAFAASRDLQRADWQDLIESRLCRVASSLLLLWFRKVSYFTLQVSPLLLRKLEPPPGNATIIPFSPNRLSAAVSKVGAGLYDHRSPLQTSRSQSLTFLSTLAQALVHWHFQTIVLVLKPLQSLRLNYISPKEHYRCYHLFFNRFLRIQSGRVSRSWRWSLQFTFYRLDDKWQKVDTTTS